MTDILGAVYSFLAQYVPDVNAGSIVRGWQNRAALPDDTDYVVLTLTTARRHGTNVVEWKNNEASATDLIETIHMHTEYTVQVDFCGTDEQTVMARATRLAALARSGEAVDFFKAYKILPLYAEDIRSMPYANEQRQWETRFIVTLHLENWTNVPIDRDAFTDVNLYIEDVDVHHPITTE